MNSSKVSHDHGAITVGSSSPDSVVSLQYNPVAVFTHTPQSDPTEKPTVTIVNSSKKTMTITRDRDVVTVSPSTSEDLLDGDTIHIVIGIPLRWVLTTFLRGSQGLIERRSLRWHPICCYATANRNKSSISFDACSSLGISRL